MKRFMCASIGILVLAGTLAVAAPVCGQGDVMHHWGFTHHDGGMLFGLGFVPWIAPPLIVDLDNYQYTWVMEGLVLDDSYVEGGIEYYFYSGGTLKIYEDTVQPWNAVYSDANCQAPDWVGYISDASTFQDGEMILMGEFLSLTRTFYTDYGFGDYDGELDLVGGTQLSEIPVEYQNGWTFGGTTDQPWACVPEDYEHRWDGQLFLTYDPTTTEASTWSGIKSFYR